jgi:ribonuclease-3
MMHMDLESLQNTIGYQFRDKDLIREALTHRSFAYEAQDRAVRDNGRLEFLGDSVLGMVIAEYLHTNEPAFSEGELTRHRSLLVNRNNLCRKAQEMNLSQHLFLGKGEEKTGGRKNSTNLAGALEAVIGAVYLDGGLEEARRFIMEGLFKDEFTLPRHP